MIEYYCASIYHQWYRYSEKNRTQIIFQRLGKDNAYNIISSSIINSSARKIPRDRRRRTTQFARQNAVNSRVCISYIIMIIIIINRFLSLSDGPKRWMTSSPSCVCGTRANIYRFASRVFLFAIQDCGKGGSLQWQWQ